VADEDGALAGGVDVDVVDAATGPDDQHQVRRRLDEPAGDRGVGDHEDLAVLDRAGQLQGAEARVLGDAQPERLQA
jgi:hypothetical protein